MPWKQQVMPVTSTSARVQWPTPLVSRCGRLRGGVCAQGAEVADEDYKRDGRTKSYARQVQAPTRDSFGHGTSLARPQKSTSHTQLGTYGPGYFIVPWFTTQLAMCASEYPSWCKAAICPTSNGPSFAKERLRFGIALIRRRRRKRDVNGGRE